MDLEKYLDIKEDVKEALREGRPVVALESTILSHGMPYPENLSFAA
ncbi:MAG: pseudouridine-5'-phosphate glycosidase, partial [Firmicutes bacterium]|nr:pseudouridine-5'-phosphate glycosidase [Bacillota bacterium]